jgi:hypothetical protein
VQALGGEIVGDVGSASGTGIDSERPADRLHAIREVGQVGSALDRPGIESLPVVLDGTIAAATNTCAVEGDTRARTNGPTVIESPTP